MHYKIKIFTGETWQKIEASLNKWLSEVKIDLVAIHPAMAITTVPAQQARTTPSPIAGLTALQVQLVAANSIVVVYQEEQVGTE